MILDSLPGLDSNPNISLRHRQVSYLLRYIPLLILLYLVIYPLRCTSLSSSSLISRKKEQVPTKKTWVAGTGLEPVTPDNDSGKFPLLHPALLSACVVKGAQALLVVSNPDQMGSVLCQGSHLDGNGQATYSTPVNFLVKNTAPLRTRYTAVSTWPYQSTPRRIWTLISASVAPRSFH